LGVYWRNGYAYHHRRSDSIKRLLDERQQLTSRIAAIDATLVRVAGVLSPNGRPAKPVNGPKAPAPAPAKAAVGGKKKRIRRTFAISGEQSVLNFVKKNTSPVGRAIEAQWKTEGRAGTAANVLSKLTKEKKLKRIPSRANAAAATRWLTSAEHVCHSLTWALQLKTEKRLRQRSDKVAAPLEW